MTGDAKAGADGSAYVNHVELVRKARGAELPPSFWTDPLIYQGGSDDLLGARRAPRTCRCAPLIQLRLGSAYPSPSLRILLPQGEKGAYAIDSALQRIPPPKMGGG